MQGQGLVAFNDYYDQFVVFNKGNFEILSTQPAQEFQVGGNSILFKSFSGHISNYREGEIHRYDLNVQNFVALDKISAYDIFGVLKVVKESEIETLTAHASYWDASDSLLLFYDSQRYYISVYYQDSIYRVEDVILRKNRIRNRMASNVFAFISPVSNELKIFYRGDIFVLEPYMDQLTFKAGKDILAYQDDNTQEFKVFYKGQTKTLELLPVRSFETAYGMVAYVTYEGEFKVFDKGDIHTILSYEPDFFHIKDERLIFGDRNRFCLYNEGAYDILEKYIPSQYTISRDMLAYMSANDKLILFYDGEKKVLTTEQINYYQLIRDLVLISIGHNKYMVWYKGKKYWY
jgi:hypothetical protein